ncbi:MAG: c-type cytochrome [Pseudomonadales bacterium]|nr:c-type cytochrome [Pseudomonadales bacterium]
MNMRVSAFWRAIIVIICAWLVFYWAFPPFMPQSLIITFMIITVIGVLLYYSSDDKLFAEFKAPLVATLRDDNKWALRWAFLICVPLLLGYLVYGAVKPSLDTPMELRQVHPAPPATLKVYDKTYDLATLENPVRLNVLEQLNKDPGQAWEAYREAVRGGSQVYYRNCFYCHGDLLDGKGHFAQGFDPLPTNFRDVGTIAQLQESFLFWRITTGGPGLPQGGMPWKSAMPVWHESLSEEEVWNVITFLFDTVGQVPRMWDQAISKAVTGMKEEVTAQRSKMDAKAIYQFRCAVCHGEEGAGDGSAAEFLYPRPRDFTLGLFKYKSSPGTLPPRDEDLFNIIKNGLTGTSMPGWASVLTDAQIRDQILQVKRFDTSGVWAPEDAENEAFDDDGHYLKSDLTVVTEQEPVAGQIPFSDDSIARGKEVFEENCKKCHGVEGRGDITSGEFLEDDWGYRIWSRNLTTPWLWRYTEVAGDDADSRDQTIRNIAARLSIGIPGTPMPAHRATDEGEEDSIEAADRWHVANYTYALRTNASAPGVRRVIEGLEVFGELPGSVDDEAWIQAPASTFSLVPNIIKGERLFTPLNDAITVRALYNEHEIAFLLEVDDRTESRPGGPITERFPNGDEKMFPDAIAIQFPQEGAYSTVPVDKPLYRHGDSSHHTTIWYWNAGSVEPPVEPRATLHDGSGPDNKLVMRELTANDLMAQGEWRHGRWRVLMKRPRNLHGSLNLDKKDQDLRFTEGQFIPISFANWDGNNAEVGSRHTLTTWYWLLLPPEINDRFVYGAPLVVACGAFLLALIGVRGQRRKTTDRT